MLERIRFERFTAFEALEVDFSPGVNIFVGENGTGKTHIMKAAYAACDFSKTKGGYAEKINNVFLPSGKQIGRLVKRAHASSNGFVEVLRKVNDKPIHLKLKLSNHVKLAEKATVTGSARWQEYPIDAAYIPVKDMMANAPGFRSLYEEREVHFEEIYSDILRKAFIPALKGPIESRRKTLLSALQKAMDGKVVAKSEEFFLRSKHGQLEFTLLAEGYRKLGLLWLLIQNGTLLGGSSLFWDEPETNLNPKLMQAVVGILLALQRQGVQIFVSTHDYVILKEFELQATKDDDMSIHSLFRSPESGEIVCSTVRCLRDVSPNVIGDTFGGLVTRQIQRDLAGAE